MGRVVGRASDERLLRWIGDRCRGLTLREIADRHGVTSVQVVKATNAVLVADMALCGVQVAGSYW